MSMLPHPIEARLTLYTKLLMAALTLMMVDAGGIASLITMQINPAIFSTTVTLIHAGGAVFIVACLLSSFFLRKVIQQIKLSDNYYDASIK